MHSELFVLTSVALRLCASVVVMSAIAVHNIPEGLAIAVPVLASTGDRWKAIWMTLASGMSEPLGTRFHLHNQSPTLTAAYMWSELTWSCSKMCL